MRYEPISSSELAIAAATVIELEHKIHRRDLLWRSLKESPLFSITGGEIEIEYEDMTGDMREPMMAIVAKQRLSLIEKRDSLLAMVAKSQGAIIGAKT